MSDLLSSRNLLNNKDFSTVNVFTKEVLGTFNAWGVDHEGYVRPRRGRHVLVPAPVGEMHCAAQDPGQVMSGQNPRVLHFWRETP